jgi:hypothetical protein
VPEGLRGRVCEAWVQHVRRLNWAEAREVLATEIERLRCTQRKELLHLLDDSENYEVAGPSGTVYQVEVEAWWEDTPSENLHVLVAVDDGGWSAFKPICDAFIVAPDGSFVGE